MVQLLKLQFSLDTIVPLTFLYHVVQLMDLFENDISTFEVISDSKLNDCSIVTMIYLFNRCQLHSDLLQLGQYLFLHRDVMIMNMKRLVQLTN